MSPIIFVCIQIYLTLVIVEGMVGKPLIKPIIAHSKQFFELAATLITVFFTILATIIGLVFKIWAFVRDLLKNR